MNEKYMIKIISVCSYIFGVSFIMIGAMFAPVFGYGLRFSLALFGLLLLIPLMGVDKK